MVYEPSDPKQAYWPERKQCKFMGHEPNEPKKVFNRRKLQVSLSSRPEMSDEVQYYTAGCFIKVPLYLWAL